MCKNTKNILPKEKFIVGGVLGDGKKRGQKKKKAQAAKMFFLKLKYNSGPY